MFHVVIKNIVLLLQDSVVAVWYNCVGSVVQALLCSASSPEENVGGDVKIRAVAETWLP